MKKIILTVFVLALLSFSANAEKSSGNDPAFSKGSKSMGLSMGFGVNYGYYGSVVSLPAFALTYDQGFFDNVGPGNIGIGGIIGFKTAYYDYPGSNYKASWTNYIVAVRGTYHLTLLKDKNNKFDPYGGVMLGVRFLGYKDTYYNNQVNNPNDFRKVYLVSGIFVGAKYNFTRNFGAFAELGYDISFARIGICLNFK